MSFYLLISNYVGRDVVLGEHLHHRGGDVAGAHQGEGGLPTVLHLRTVVHNCLPQCSKSGSCVICVGQQHRHLPVSVLALHIDLLLLGVGGVCRRGLYGRLHCESCCIGVERSFTLSIVVVVVVAVVVSSFIVTMVFMLLTSVLYYRHSHS